MAQLIPGNWREKLDERQRKEVDFAQTYAQQYHHGTTGHNQLMLIALLAGLLDEREPGAYERYKRTYHFQVNRVEYTVPAADITALEVRKLARIPDTDDLWLKDLDGEPDELADRLPVPINLGHCDHVRFYTVPKAINGG